MMWIVPRVRLNSLRTMWTGPRTGYVDKGARPQRQGVLKGSRIRRLGITVLLMQPYLKIPSNTYKRSRACHPSTKAKYGWFPVCSPSFLGWRLFFVVMSPETFFFFDTNDRIVVILQFSNFLLYINDRNNSSALWDQWRRLVMKLKSAIIKDKNKVLQFTYVRILTSWRCTILCCFFINCDWIN